MVTPLNDAATKVPPLMVLTLAIEPESVVLLIVPPLIAGALTVAPEKVEETKVPPETVPCSVSPEAMEALIVIPDIDAVHAAS